MKCQIRWIDQNGDPTPDDNEAEYMATYYFPEINEKSEPFPCCEKHKEKGKEYHNWTFDPIIKDNIILGEN